nr:ribosomal protein S11 [Lithodesmioides sp. mgcode 4]
MFLSKNLLKIIKKVKFNNVKKNVTYEFNLVEKLANKIYYLKKIKSKNIKYLKTFSIVKFLVKNNVLIAKLNNTNFNMLKNNNPLVLYIVTINFSSTNTRIYFSDIEGQIKKSYSAGSVKLQGKQKIKRYVAFINILKQMLIETKSFYKTPIILHLRNITKNYPLKRIIKLLKNNFIITSIISFNSKPHNGCRPRKLKRLK